MRERATAARSEQKAADARAIVAAPKLTSEAVAQLENQENLSPEQNRSIQRFYLQEFYALPDLNEADVLWDNEGRRRGEILNLEALLYPHVAVDRTVKGLQQQATWNQGLCPWDISNAVLRQSLRSLIGLDHLFARAREGWEWTAYDLKPYADQARSAAAQIKTVLHLTIHSEMSDVQVMHQLLSQLGLRITFRWSRAVEGYQGEKLRVYQLDQLHWQQLYEVIERRARRRANYDPQGLSEALKLASTGSPLSFNDFITTGDPAPLVLPIWNGVSEIQRCSQKLCQHLVEADANPSALLKSWPHSLRVSVIYHLSEHYPGWFERLVSTVPDLFAWCATES